MWDDDSLPAFTWHCACRSHSFLRHFPANGCYLAVPILGEKGPSFEMAAAWFKTSAAGIKPTWSSLMLKCFVISQSQTKIITRWPVTKLSCALAKNQSSRKKLRSPLLKVLCAPHDPYGMSRAVVANLRLTVLCAVCNAETSKFLLPLIYRLLS